MPQFSICLKGDTMPRPCFFPGCYALEKRIYDAATPEDRITIERGYLRSPWITHYTPEPVTATDGNEKIFQIGN